MSYAAVQAGHLKNHMKTQSGKKPYKCAQCPYTASVASHSDQFLYAAGKVGDLKKHKPIQEKKHTV